MDNPASPSDDLPPLLSEPAKPVQASRRRWWFHVLIIAAYPVVIGIWSWWQRGPTHNPALSGTPRGLLIVCTLELLVFGAVFGLAWLASRASPDDLLLRWRNGFWTVPLGIGYSIALRFALGLVAAVVAAMLIISGLATEQSLSQFAMTNRPDVEAVVDISAMRENPLYFWLTLTFVSFVVAGLREELWRSGFLCGLRSLWPRCFGSRGGQIAAAGIAAVCFGIGHLGMGVLAVGLTTLLGFGLGVIMIMHRSIWPAVFAHGMLDATSLALLPWVMEHLKQLPQTLGH